MTESQTLISLVQQSVRLSEDIELKLNIHDNSRVSRLDNQIISSLNDFYDVNYKHTPENKTLREIYNDCIVKLDGHDILLLLDDDTTLPPNYIEELLRYVKNYPDCLLFAPKVIVRGELYSPYKSVSFISRPLGNIKSGKIESFNHSFINSGLAIRGKFFIESRFSYPKGVDFYGTDTVFSHAFRNFSPTYVLMNLQLNHDVNNHPGNRDAYSYASALSKVMKFWLGQLNGVAKIAYVVFMIFYLAKMTIKFRSCAFIKMLIGLK